MQRWLLTCEASTIEAHIGDGVNWRSMSVTFTILGTRGDVNFSFKSTDWNSDSDGERDIAGWRYTPETIVDIEILDRACVEILVIND